MKKVLFLACAAAVAASASAQKANINAAENAVILQQYDNAKESIDKALENEKTKDFAKAYIVASKVYLHLANKDASAIDKSKQFIAKAVELNEKGNAKGKAIGKFTKDISKAYGELASIAENVAGVAYNDKDYNTSKEAFIYSLWARSQAPDYNEIADSSLIVNVGIASMQAEDWKTGAEYFLKAGRMRVGEAMSFFRAKYCFEQLKDSASIESTLKEGFEAYPQVTDMINTLINYYISAQKNDEALVYLNSAIDKDPGNAQYFFARGCLKEKTSVDEAMKDYETALKLDPKSFGASYNMGILFYNQALVKKQEASGERDNAKYNAMIQASNDLFGKAVPFFEMAASNAPDNKNKREVLENLRRTYYTLANYDKSKEVKDQIDAIDAGQ